MASGGCIAAFTDEGTLQWGFEAARAVTRYRVGWGEPGKTFAVDLDRTAAPPRSGWGAGSVNASSARSAAGGVAAWPPAADRPERRHVGACPVALTAVGGRTGREAT